MRKSIACLLFGGLCLLPGIASADVTVYTDEVTFLNALASLGSSTLQESFENDAVWGVARSPLTAASVTSQGITWTTNHPSTNEITTSGGNARTGSWAVYDSDHGYSTGTVTQCDVTNPPDKCFMHDGFSGSITGPDLIYGVGGYIFGYAGADVDIIIKGTAHNAGPLFGTEHQFMGVIDTAGFNSFEYRELEGTVEQRLFIFGDDFTIATSATIPDNNAPVLAAIGDQTTDENVELTVPLSASDADGDNLSFSMSGEPVGATLNDNGDGTADFVWTPDYSQAGSYTVTFTVADSATPAATDTETITITVNDVNRPPVLSSIGNQSVDENTLLTILLSATDLDGNTLSFSKSTGPTGSSLVDNNDGTATFSWTPDIGTADDYPVMFTVTDNGVPAINDSESIIITVIASIVDVTPPVITLLGSDTVSIEAGSSYTDAGASALDDIDGDISSNIIVTGTVDTTTVGSYMLTYNVSDAAGNAAAPVTRTVNVTADVTAPVIMLLGDNPMSLEAGNSYVEPGATATDNLDGDISGSIVIAGTVNTGVVGSYSVTYNVSDAAGNPATEVTRTVNVTSSAPGTLQFSAAVYSVSEVGVSAIITVTRLGGSFGAVAVDYASSDGTATAGSDYTAVSGSLSFADGETSRTFTVPIIDDAVYEGDETLNLALSNPTGGTSLGSPATAVLTISEDDPVPPSGSLQFSAPSYTVVENGATATITVTRVGGSFGAVGVDYTSNDGTASAGSDYTAMSGSLSFSDGELTRTFTVPILDDVTYEGDETLNFGLSNPTGGAGLDSPSTTILTITEDDPVPPSGGLQFSAPTYTVAENGTTATITVARVGGSFGIVGVDYASSDASASAGSDYTAVSGSLSFSDGELTRTFTVPILDDMTYEGDETVDLSLSNPTGGAGLGSPASSVLTISEDDPVPPSGSLQFSAPTYTVAENGAIATITVTRIGGSFGVVGVDYTSSDASATAGSDYTAVSGSLSFADGELTRAFTVPILDDVDYEGDETLNLTLSNPIGNAGLDSPSISSLTIIEDETQTDDDSAGGSSGGSINLITLIVLFSLYLRNFLMKDIYKRKSLMLDTSFRRYDEI